MCNCFEIIEKNLIEKTGDPLASLTYMYAMPSFAKRAVVEATYRKKNKNGDFQKKLESISMAYPYCPFCGEKLPESV